VTITGTCNEPVGACSGTMFLYDFVKVIAPWLSEVIAIARLGLSSR
jgi:hypothetical protein